ncbi:SgcJ/EcaC family oxidoreductase [Nocardioides sp. GBK3QG-3]|uniref:SgcJ/EcaC family oxidoreductase n=2 Tax=Nocardioides mangrovi TaxID=2874580 RepID=A0ABS7UK89_9ACTN|nr:SgcJ/EcaC family oxidoreductase [Nocardioides mangrovi]
MTVSTTDLDEIRALIDDVAAGVNSHDPDRCVAHVHADAVFVVANGSRAHGRAAVRAAHERAFAAAATPAGDARFVVLDAAFPRPDLAVVTTGAYRAGPDEAVDLERPSMVVLWTLAREAGGWSVVARQFTPVG